MSEEIDYLGRCLLREGDAVNTGHWQSLKGTPHAKSIELTNMIYQLGLPEDMDALAREVEPNLPWAEDHFQERVGGEPLNPGEQYKNWPWYVADWAAQQGVEQKFSHTYMERFWPRHGVNNKPGYPENRTFPDAPIYHKQGLRYRYGDLNDVLSLLAREPYTRQAYLPIWFPEDTGAHHGERVPCTLGYHFLLRGGQLHINYFIRSCDFLRYFRDDVYMAGRLCQWIVASLTHLDIPDDQPPHEEVPWAWENVTPGTLTMFISSLHIFEGDLPKMRRLYG